MSENYKEEITFLRAVIFLTLAFLIIIGNIFVLLALQKVKKLKQSTKLFILSLTVADLLVACLLIPLRLNEVFYAPWTRTVTWCKLSISVNILNLTASALNLIVMMIDRLIYLRAPLHYDMIVTPRRSLRVLAVLWIFVLAVSFVPIFSGSAILPGAHRDKTDHLCKYASILRKDYLIYMCIGDIIPLVIFSIVYADILRIAHRQMQQLQALARSTLSFVEVKKLKSREKRTTRMFTSLIVVFYVCWVPTIVVVYLSINHGELVTQSAIMVISTLVYTNSFFNCIVYYMCNDEFRRHFRKLLQFKERPLSHQELKSRRRTLSQLRLGEKSPQPLIFGTVSFDSLLQEDTSKRNTMQAELESTNF